MSRWLRIAFGSCTYFHIYIYRSYCLHLYLLNESKDLFIFCYLYSNIDIQNEVAADDYHLSTIKLQAYCCLVSNCSNFFFFYHTAHFLYAFVYAWIICVYGALSWNKKLVSLLQIKRKTAANPNSTRILPLFSRDATYSATYFRKNETISSEGFSWKLFQYFQKQKMTNKQEVHFFVENIGQKWQVSWNRLESSISLYDSSSSSQLFLANTQRFQPEFRRFRRKKIRYFNFGSIFYFIINKQNQLNRTLAAHANANERLNYNI